ncbi:type II toxin-antitoxin system RatA family toxin [Nocardia sp. NPDC059240]|uniref:type II toxin-antitoxin system RatA family toxin n=1 Tax=Nocardia sp. NPDC059240 TaxID=3346786 RepID=UPI0036B86776
MTSRHAMSCPPEQLWSVLLDYAAFPEYMTGVNDVEILDDEGTRRTSSWVVELKGSEMEWEQEDVISVEHRRIEFRQTDGDLAVYQGYWQIHPEELELSVEFDIGMPLVAEMIHPAIAKALDGYAGSVVAHAEQ